MGSRINRDGRKRSAYELLSYPEIDLARLESIWPEIGSIDPAIAGANHRRMRAMPST